MPNSLTEIRSRIRPWLLFFWCIWATLLFAPIGVAWVNHSGHYHIPNWCMLASSIVLTITGWTWYATLQAREPSGQFKFARRIALLMTMGMLLGTLGDFFNSKRLQEIVPLSNPLLGGLLSFLLGHVCYIAACVMLAKRCNFSNSKTWCLALTFWQILAILAWYLVLFRSDTESVLLWAALPYSMFLAGTAGVTTALALHDKRLTLLALGSALFFVSDLILGYQITHERIFPNGELVWLTYGPGQMLIVFAIGTMIGLLPIANPKKQSQLAV